MYKKNYWQNLSILLCYDKIFTFNQIYTYFLTIYNQSLYFELKPLYSNNKLHNNNELKGNVYILIYSYIH